MFKKILYPTDFSESAQAAFEYVKKLKDAGTEEVVLLHVYDEKYIDIHWEIESFEKVKHDVVKALLKKNYNKLKELEKQLNDLGLKTEMIVDEGIPFEMITKTSEEFNVSIIVMGSHGERGFIEKILGSTTGRVLQRSKIPVLIVKPKMDKS